MAAEIDRVQEEVLDATIRQKAQEAGELAQAADPAEAEEVQRGKRTDELVDQITDAAIAELRTLRDHLDDQIRAMLARRDMLKAQIGEQVAFAQQAIKVKVIVANNIVDLTRAIEQGMAPVAKTITARRGNGSSR